MLTPCGACSFVITNNQSNAIAAELQGQKFNMLDAELHQSAPIAQLLRHNSCSCRLSSSVNGPLVVMRAQLHVEDEVMWDIAQLFTNHSWELNEIGLEDGDEEDARSLCTIEITEVQWNAIYYHVDLLDNDFRLFHDEDQCQQPEEAASELQGISVRVNVQQAVELRQFLQSRGIQEVDEARRQDDDGRYHIPATPDEEECQQCFCQPCVTVETNRQVWWAIENSTAHSSNHQLRKRAYFKFWTMLYHRGAWQDRRYLDKKRQRLPTSGLFKREIMPTCVLSMVRR